MTERALTAVANYHCQVGENPLWNDRDGRLYWEDIDTGRLFWVRHDTLEHHCFHQGEVVGGFTFQADGKLLLFGAGRISTLDPETGARRVLREGIDADMSRFNDVIADPEGRVYAGTIGRSVRSGGLYRVDLDGSVTCLWKGSGCANGMGFSVDGKRFYWTCSTRRTIFAYDYDQRSGALSNERVLYRAPEEEGIPDGLAVDERDEIWTARWDGHAVLRLSPDGRLLDRVSLPVPKVSSVAFGGPERDTLYVTTACLQVTDSDEGTLYRMPAGVRGRAEFRSKIGL
jgi:D-xylono/L-arabinono-1,4-lactonase